MTVDQKEAIKYELSSEERRRAGTKSHKKATMGL